MFFFFFLELKDNIFLQFRFFFLFQYMTVQVSTQLAPNSLPSITTSACGSPMYQSPYGALAASPAVAPPGLAAAGMPTASGGTPPGASPSPAPQPAPCAVESSDMWRGTSIASLRRKALEHTASMSVFRWAASDALCWTPCWIEPVHERYVVHRAKDRLYRDTGWSWELLFM